MNCSFFAVQRTTAGILITSSFTKNTSYFAPVVANGKFSGRIEGCVVGVRCMLDVCLRQDRITVVSVQCSSDTELRHCHFIFSNEMSYFSAKCEVGLKVCDSDTQDTVL